MPATEFNPLNELENALVDAMSSRIPVDEFLKILLRSEVHISSGGEVQVDGSGFQPLLFDNAEGTLMAAFTARERATRFGDKAPFCLTMKGDQLIQRIPQNLGLVLNPGFSFGFELPPGGVERVRREFTKSNKD